MTTKSVSGDDAQSECLFVAQACVVGAAHANGEGRPGAAAEGRAREQLASTDDEFRVIAEAGDQRVGVRVAFRWDQLFSTPR